MTSNTNSLQRDEYAIDPAEQCAVQSVDPVPDIAGIDTLLGVQNSGDDGELYLELLSIFVADYADFSRNIVRHISVDQWEDARRLAHTLKSVTGVLGIIRVHAFAERLEIACKQQSVETTRQCLAAVEAELSSVLAELQRFFADLKRLSADRGANVS